MLFFRYSILRGIVRDLADNTQDQLSAKFVQVCTLAIVNQISA